MFDDIFEKIVIKDPYEDNDSSQQAIKKWENKWLKRFEESNDKMEYAIWIDLLYKPFGYNKGFMSYLMYEWDYPINRSEIDNIEYEIHPNLSKIMYLAITELIENDNIEADDIYTKASSLLTDYLKNNNFEYIDKIDSKRYIFDVFKYGNIYTQQSTRDFSQQLLEDYYNDKINITNEKIIETLNKIIKPLNIGSEYSDLICRMKKSILVDRNNILKETIYDFLLDTEDENITKLLIKKIKYKLKIIETKELYELYETMKNLSDINNISNEELKKINSFIDDI